MLQDYASLPLAVFAAAAGYWVEGGGWGWMDAGGIGRVAMSIKMREGGLSNPQPVSVCCVGAGCWLMAGWARRVAARAARLAGWRVRLAASWPAFLAPALPSCLHLFACVHICMLALACVLGMN